MKARQFGIGAALVIATAAITSQVVSQNAGKSEPPPPSPEELAMQQKWEEFMTPGENHKLLNFKVGKWNGTIKMWMEPGQLEPIASNCTSEIKWIMDGRYLTETVKGDFMGAPFDGHAIIGYDNLKKSYGWVWIDNMGTGFMVAEGKYDAAKKTFKYSYEHPDLMEGKYKKGHSIERIVNENTWVNEMYNHGPDGKEYKMMEITYTRAK